jgi:TRAP-type C4-dicarboxylate transport system permease small subunit
MADPLESEVTVEAPGPRAQWKGPLGDAGWALAWLDYAVYTAEHAVVVMSLIAMTVVEFVYILSIYVTEQKINLARFQDPAQEAPIPWSAVVLLGFVWALVFSVVGSTRLGRGADGAPRPWPLRLLASLGLLAAVVGFASLTLVLQSSAQFYLLLVALVMGPTLAYFWRRGQKGAVGVLAGVTLGALGLAWAVPEGYSWADKRALFLLLWVGFLGASMATRQGKHIKLDIARKLCPPRLLRWYNALSYFVAASFTGFLVYLGWIYMFHEDYGRFWSRTVPGEIPDWLVVLAIPVSLLLMTLRFAAKAVAAVVAPAEEVRS